MTTLKLYTSVVSCPLLCTGIIRDADSHIPRGFFTLAEPGDEISLLVVGQNPGQPHGAAEAGLYSGLSPSQATRKHLQFVKECFLGGIGKPFHRRLLDWLCDLLKVSSSEVFRQVVYTNLVKCSTPDNKVPRRDLVSTCYAQHLRREIAAWQPRIVVGLGTTTCKALPDLLRNLPIKVHSLPHPSHRERGNYHRSYLEDIRRALASRR